MKRSLASVLVLAACAGGESPRTTTADRALAGEAVALEMAASTSWAATGELDPALDKELIGAIEQGLASHDNAVVTAHALVQWTRLVRHRLGDPMHSVVPGVADDPDCAGSVIGDGTLIGYVAAVGSKRDVTGASASLQTLARHLACLGDQQVVELATAMVIAYDDLASTLDRNGRADALPYVAQAIAQPMLLVQDVERRRGPEAPLARWFRSHADVLAEGAGGFHQPATWHGLWLYDRSLGRLVGFTATRAEDRASENSIDLNALYATLAAATLEDNACSLAEMVRRGRGPDGRYWCRAQACAQLDSPDCHVALSRDVDQGAGGFATITPALSTTEALACVAAQVVKPGKQQMTCVLEASGHAAAPYDSFVKQLTEVSLAGIKLGDGCQLSQIASGAPGDPFAAREQAARDLYELEVRTARQELHDRIEKLIKAQKERDDVFAADGANSPQGAAAQQKVDDAEEAVNLAIATIDQQLADAQAKRDAELEKIKKERAAAAAAEGKAHYCDPNLSASCANGCSAMARQAAAFAACFADETRTVDPYRDGCGLDCDPSEPTVAMPASASCLGSLETTKPARLQARECWSSRCASSAADDGCCGAGGFLSTGDPALPDLCGIAHCDPGSAASVVGGACGCGGAYDPPPGAGGFQIPH